ncbi:hypothetical protein C8R47DRAFT_1116266 [Mycena vitilis]|nr:hypothetical protein C8R47DRAFT_1116266 [Mycena vitilis]
MEIIPGGIEPWLAEPPGAARPTRESPFLYVDGHLGVPKKILYQLYLSALGMLKSDIITSQLDSSSVILLTNPAHQTALNVRKRLIQSGALSPHAELRFSATLLPSSRPCSKESIQWAHRRWIFNILYPRVLGDFGPPLQGWARNSPTEVPEIPPDAVENEFELISKCCESYPRNYHAWTHHHFVVQCIYVSIRSCRPADFPYLAPLTGEFTRLRGWVESHVSDHSAIHHFCSLISRFQSLDLAQYHSVLGPLANLSVHFEHAISLVAAFPSHESLWMYLRAVIKLSPDANTLAASAILTTAALDSPHRDKFVLWVKNRDRHVIVMSQ